MKTTRGMQAEPDVGRHYILDARRNWVVAKDCDLEAIAKDLNVLAPL